MNECYDVAAVRHMRTAECLEAAGHLDDAGYHVGVCAENAVKSAMRESGLEAYWRSQGNKVFKASPMKGHWSLLQVKIAASLDDIRLNATGRRAASLFALASAGPTAKFANWSIDIRYADPAHVPISFESFTAWKNDAGDFIVEFVVAA